MFGFSVLTKVALRPLTFFTHESKAFWRFIEQSFLAFY
jgi:hypothetical protein